jgi:ubiquinol-cytochrome c reductase cytochrome b/c1 subunit
MRKMTKLKTLAAAVALTLLAGTPALASGTQLDAKGISYSFEGVFGKFDRAQLQRGYKVYKEVCAACHSARFMYFRNLGEPGGPEFSAEEVKAIAASFEVQDGPNADGEMFMRPGLASDHFPSPYPNEQASRAANGGAYPPDLSLITKNREGWRGTFNQLWNGIGGPQYVYSVLTGYETEPAELAAEKPEGKYFNPYFANGHWIGMAPPLSDDQVTFDDGSPSTVDAMSRDVSAFLAWTAEPKMEERKRTGFQVMIFLLVFSVLLYLTKNKIWRNVEH